MAVAGCMGVAVCQIRKIRRQGYYSCYSRNLKKSRKTRKHFEKVQTVIQKMCVICTYSNEIHTHTAVDRLTPRKESKATADTDKSRKDSF